MSEDSSTEYKDGDIVWVKLGPSWWPGEIADLDSLPSDEIEFKKPPLAVVKFFEENTYEYVRNWTNIHPYNCERKSEFIKKGMAAFRSKAPHMEKFPKDVTTAEVKQGGNPNILSDPAYRPEKKMNYVAEVFGTPSPKKSLKDSHKKSRFSNKFSPKDSAHITHRRFLGLDDYKAYICIQYPGKDRVPGDSEDEEVIRINAEPEQEYNCHSCSYSTKRLEVMILHTKSHIQGVYISSPRRKRPITGRPRKKEYTKKRLCNYSDDSSNDESILDTPKEKKRKTRVISSPKKPAKPIIVEEEKPKPPTDIRNDLLAEWEDSDDDLDTSLLIDSMKDCESLDKTEDSKLDESNEMSDKNSIEGTKESENDNKQMSDVESDPPNARTKSEELGRPQMDKETQEAIKSCFDFDEDDEDEQSLLNTTVAVGRKIPRVIPPTEKRKSEILEDIIDLEEEGINKEDILKVSQSFNEKLVDKDKEEIECAFKDLMDTTSVPKLPEIENTLKPTQNFHCVKTIKFPDKPVESPKKDREKLLAEVPINPKKRFVKSFVDFENQLQQKEILRKEKEESMTRKDDGVICQKEKTVDSLTKLKDNKNNNQVLEEQVSLFSQKEESFIMKDKADEEDSSFSLNEKGTKSSHTTSDSSEDDIDLTKLQTSIMSKIIEEAKITDESKERILTRMKDKHLKSKSYHEKNTIKKRLLAESRCLRSQSQETPEMEMATDESTLQNTHDDGKSSKVPFKKSRWSRRVKNQDLQANKVVEEISDENHSLLVEKLALEVTNRNDESNILENENIHEEGTSSFETGKVSESQPKESDVSESNQFFKEYCAKESFSKTSEKMNEGTMGEGSSAQQSAEELSTDRVTNENLPESFAEEIPSEVHMENKSVEDMSADENIEITSDQIMDSKSSQNETFEDKNIQSKSIIDEINSESKSNNGLLMSSTESESFPGQNREEEMKELDTSSGINNDCVSNTEEIPLPVLSEQNEEISTPGPVSQQDEICEAVLKPNKRKKGRRKSNKYAAKKRRKYSGDNNVIEGENSNIVNLESSIRSPESTLHGEDNTNKTNEITLQEDTGNVPDRQSPTNGEEENTVGVSESPIETTMKEYIDSNLYPIEDKPVTRIEAVEEETIFEVTIDQESSKYNSDVDTQKNESDEVIEKTEATEEPVVQDQVAIEEESIVSENTPDMVSTIAEVELTPEEHMASESSFLSAKLESEKELQIEADEEHATDTTEFSMIAAKHEQCSREKQEAEVEKNALTENEHFSTELLVNEGGENGVTEKEMPKELDETELQIEETISEECKTESEKTVITEEEYVVRKQQSQNNVLSQEHTEPQTEGSVIIEEPTVLQHNEEMEKDEVSKEDLIREDLSTSQKIEPEEGETTEEKVIRDDESEAHIETEDDKDLRPVKQVIIEHGSELPIETEGNIVSEEYVTEEPSANYIEAQEEESGDKEFIVEVPEEKEEECISEVPKMTDENLSEISNLTEAETISEMSNVTEKEHVFKLPIEVEEECTFRVPQIVEQCSQEELVNEEQPINQRELVSDEEHVIVEQHVAANSEADQLTESNADTFELIESKDDKMEQNNPAGIQNENKLESKKSISFNDIPIDDEDEKLTDLVSDIVQKLSQDESDKNHEDLEIDDRKIETPTSSVEHSSQIQNETLLANSDSSDDTTVVENIEKNDEKTNEDDPETSKEVEIHCANSSEDAFKFSIQTNLSNLSRSEEISAIALATLSVIKTDLECSDTSSNLSTDVAPKTDLNFPEKLSDTEMVAIEGNLTVMSEKDLADAQVEITTEKVISSKKPVMLSNFSMDFSDSASDSGSLNEASNEAIKFVEFDSKGTEFTSRAITKEMKPKIPAKKANAYDQCELLNILEDDTDKEKKVVEFQTPTKSYAGDIMDFEDCIPSQIVCTKQFKQGMDDEMKKKDQISVISTTSKLLERLTDGKLLESNNEIPSDIPANIKNQKIKSKPIILSEQIIKPATAEVKKVLPATVNTVNDIEDVEAFVIHKDLKKNVEVEETKQVPVKTLRRPRAKPMGKAKILQQTIITPAGEILQPAITLSKKKIDSSIPVSSSQIRLAADTIPSLITSSKSKSSATVVSDVKSGSNIQDDNIFDIFNMPIVLSDQILTPETIENMPIVIDAQSSISKATQNIATPTSMNKVVAKVVTTTSSTTIPSKSSTLTPRHQKPRILQTLTAKSAISSSALPAVAKPGKYILVPQGTTGIPQSKYQPKKAVMKRTSLPMTLGSKLLNQPEATGNKIMVVTNHQGQQQRLLLTPAQQKVLGYQSPSGPKIAKTVVKTNVLQKNILTPLSTKTEASSSKTTSMLAQKLIGNQLATGTPTSRTVKSFTKSKVTPTSQKVVPGQSKTAKTILITNKHGQTIKKIATTEDDIDKQVAAQLEAIKASSGMQFGSQLKSDNPNIKSIPKIPVRSKFHNKKQETKPRMTPVLARTDLTNPPPLISTSKKLVPTAVESKKIIQEEPKPQRERPLNQLVIQDALGNQTTITEGQILALPSETVDGQPQSYMLVTLDQSGNLTPLNNEALMSLDPNLGLGGDLSNMVLQIDQGSLRAGSVDQPTPLAQPATVKLTNPGEELQAGTSKIDIPRARAPLALPVANDVPSIEQKIEQSLLVTPTEASVNIESIVSNSNGEQGQQLIVTGDPIATQKFLESLTEGTTDLANIIANAEGKSIFIQADGQQILINTNSDNQMLTNVSESTEGGGNPIFATQPNKMTDILAAALADTDVFTSQPKISSQLSPNNALYPINVGNVLETSLTLNSPIMTPLEVPSTNNKKIPDEEADILTQVPKNVDLPITITDPNISQTVANQQVATMIANELHTNLELGLGIAETAISTVSAGLTSPGYSFSLSALDENDISHKPFNSSMPLLNDDVEESSQSDEKSRDKDDSKPEENLNSERFLEEESRFTLGGGMCSSLSEPPPEMFDIPEVNSYGEKNGNIPLSLQSTPDPKDDDTTDVSNQAESSSEGSCEIPLQPKIVASSADLSEVSEM